MVPKITVVLESCVLPVQWELRFHTSTHMTVSKSLPQCSLPECLSDPNVAAAVECYTTLISLTSPSKSTTKLLEAISPISAAITSSNGLLGCTGGEVLRVDLSTKTAYSLSSASAGRPSSASHASFTGLSSATAAVASGFSRGKKSVGRWNDIEERQSETIWLSIKGPVTLSQHLS